ncbi:MAG: cyclase family protein [Oscillospiraceae bacterium]|jgi:arylformamidase|nr:cyclase family protein [Oscillospiraceae bacterium]
MIFYDITQELFSSVVFPGDLAPSFERDKTFAEDGYNLTNLSLSAHNGTHLDAPRHFVGDGAAIDEIPLGLCFGDCVVAELSGGVTAESLAPYLRETRLLLRGDITVTEDAARAVASSEIRLLGVESQSVAPPDAPAAVHVILLSAGVIPLEGLRLAGVPEGRYTLAAFPLKLAGSDGSPVRAVLMREDA